MKILLLVEHGACCGHSLCCAALSRKRQQSSQSGTDHLKRRLLQQASQIGQRGARVLKSIASGAEGTGECFGNSNIYVLWLKEAVSAAQKRDVSFRGSDHVQFALGIDSWQFKLSLRRVCLEDAFELSLHPIFGI